MACSTTAAERKGKIAILHQMGQQKSILGSKGAGLNTPVSMLPPALVASQIPPCSSTECSHLAAACSLESLGALGVQPADKGCTIPDESELKEIVLGEPAITELRAARQSARSLQSASTNTNTAPLLREFPDSSRLESQHELVRRP